MLKITNIQTCNWDAAIRGMRNPMESHAKSDTRMECPDEGTERWCGEPIIGPNDLDLMKRLVNAGTDHSKFMRMITVSFDITAPLYWWKEFDTYKIAVVRNSCSTMHKIESRHLSIDDFATDNMTNADLAIMETVILHINNLITLYKTSINNREKLELHRRIVKLLPDSYLQKATITTNYQVLRSIRNSDRKTHKLEEWKLDFMKFIDSLPYAKELLIEDEDFKYNKALEFIKSYKLKHNYTMTKEELVNEDKVTVMFNEALNGIKSYAEKKDECEGCTCYQFFSSPRVMCPHLTKEDDIMNERYEFTCIKKQTGISIPFKHICGGLEILPGAFNREEE
jgi:hypothetical protein